MSESFTTTVPSASMNTSFSPGIGCGAWVSWQLLSAIGVVLTAHFARMDVPVWALSPDVKQFLLYVGLAHVSAAVGLSWRVLKRGRVSAPGVIVAASASYAVLYTLLRYSGGFSSRYVLLIAFVLTVVCLSVSIRWIRVLLPVLLVAVGGLGSIAWGAMPEDRVVSTTLYPLRPVPHQGAVPSAVTGGSIELFEGGFLVAAGDGGLFHLTEERPGSALTSRRLPHRVPLNLDAFSSDGMRNGTGRREFRVADILMIESPAGMLKLFASHQYWIREEQCVVIRLSSAEAPRGVLLNGGAELKWETLFETKPCLPINAQTNLGEMGGRLLRLDDNSVLLTVGDVGFSGVGPDKRNLAHPESPYGKTIRIDWKNNQVETYTTGHRNAQGLYRTSDGLIWATEHGPKGGDELNLIRQGADYGWPFVSYGANYNDYVWPLDPKPGRHLGHEPPAFAWLPSIGVSSLISVEQDLFAHWKGDLLVAGMREQSLFRLRVRDGNVIFAEPIPIGRRVRDLIEAPDGRIVLLQDYGTVTFLEPTTPPPIWNVNLCQSPFLC
jgi:aldose sugar dehydrogenase